MERITLYHNPSCSKSRGALQLLESRAVEFETVEYLKHPPGRAVLEKLIDQIAEAPLAMVRVEDKRFKELGLSSNDYTARAAVIELLLVHPELMERPIVVRGGRAVIARPPEKLLELLD